LINKVISTTPVNIANDHTLYANWTAITYTITLYANGGSFNGSSTDSYGPIQHGTTVEQFMSSLPLPTRNG
jgi:hypothetical protein